jgi:nucleoid-associated protein YgaU
MVQPRNRKTRGRGRKNRGRKTRGRKQRGGSTFLGRLFTPNQARAADEAEAAKAAAAAAAATAAKVAAAKAAEEAARVAAEEKKARDESFAKFRDSIITPAFTAVEAKLKEENKSIDSLAQKWLESNEEIRGQPEVFKDTPFEFVQMNGRKESGVSEAFVIYRFKPDEVGLYRQPYYIVYIALARGTYIDPNYVENYM